MEKFLRSAVGFRWRDQDASRARIFSWSVVKYPTHPPEYTHLRGTPAAAFLASYWYAVANGYPEIHKNGYLASGLCCIGTLGCLSAKQTARLGNALGMIGVTAGTASTIGLLSPSPEVLAQMAGTADMGSILGTTIAKKIEITDLHQLLATFHALVGMAACLTSFLLSDTVQIFSEKPPGDYDPFTGREESVHHQAVEENLTVPGMEKDWPKAHAISHSDKKTGTIFTIDYIKENLLNMLAADGKDDASMSSPSATAKTLAGPSQYNTAPALPSTAFPSKPVFNQDAGLFRHTSGKSNMEQYNPGNKQMVLANQGYNDFKHNHPVVNMQRARAPRRRWT